MSEWSSRPRQNVMAGRRKATEVWCGPCRVFHKTERHAEGPDDCPYEQGRPVVDAPFVHTSRDPNPDR